MSNEEIVLTVFWAYNVDENMDKETDDGAINITNVTVFEEIYYQAISAEHKISSPRTYSRNVNLDFGNTLLHFMKNKQEPVTTCFE